MRRVLLLTVKAKGEMVVMVVLVVMVKKKCGRQGGYK